MSLFPTSSPGRWTTVMTCTTFYENLRHSAVFNDSMHLLGITLAFQVGRGHHVLFSWPLSRFGHLDCFGSSLIQPIKRIYLHA